MSLPFELPNSKPVAKCHLTRLPISAAFDCIFIRLHLQAERGHPAVRRSKEGERGEGGLQAAAWPAHAPQHKDALGGVVVLGVVQCVRHLLHLEARRGCMAHERFVRCSRPCLRTRGGGSNQSGTVGVEGGRPDNGTAAGATGAARKQTRCVYGGGGGGRTPAAEALAAKDRLDTRL